MTHDQIISLARRMAATLRDGFLHAARYLLHSLKFTVEQTLGVLRGA